MSGGSATNPEDERDEYRRNPSLLNSPSFTPSLLRATPAQPKRADRSPLPSPTEAPSAPFGGPPPRLGSIKRDKFSSEATIFLKTTIRAPDVQEIVKCLSTAIHRALVEHSQLTPIEDEVFSEKIYPLGDAYSDDEETLTRMPTLKSIHEFVTFIFDEQELSAECAVMGFAYIDRLVTLTSITLVPWNWRRVLLGALILASKVWEDLAVWNADFLSAFPELDVKDLNRLERAYLLSLQFVVTLKSSVYAKYYFELRGLSSSEADFPLKPLSKEDAAKLEMRSQGIEDSSRRFIVQKSASDTPTSGSSEGSATVADFAAKRRELRRQND